MSNFDDAPEVSEALVKYLVARYPARTILWDTPESQIRHEAGRAEVVEHLLALHVQQRAPMPPAVLPQRTVRDWLKEPRRAR